MFGSVCEMLGYLWKTPTSRVLKIPPENLLITHQRRSYRNKMLQAQSVQMAERQKGKDEAFTSCQQLVKWLDLEDKSGEIKLFALHYLPILSPHHRDCSSLRIILEFNKTTHYWLCILLFVQETFLWYKNWDVSLKRLMTISPEPDMFKNICRCMFSVSLLLLGQI